MRRLGWAVSTLLLATSAAEASPFEFGGFYAGVHAGYVDAEAEVTGGDFDGGSLMGGAQAGYNFVNGNLVYGVEIDVSLAGRGPDGGCPYAALGCAVDLGPMGTLRARLGYASGDWMVYGTGGLAASQFDLSDSSGFDSDGGLHGWTAGAGVEHLLDEIVGVKLEYRYLRYGSFGSFDKKVEDPLGRSMDVDMHVIMAGINFHF